MFTTCVRSMVIWQQSAPRASCGTDVTGMDRSSHFQRHQSIREFRRETTRKMLRNVTVCVEKSAKFQAFPVSHRDKSDQICAWKLLFRAHFVMVG